jgi:dTDP-4-dehydrorhamnose 3,5-epimerase
MPAGGDMRVTNTELPGVLLITPDVFEDPRGLFFELHHHRKYTDAGIAASFVQDNFSRSTRGTLRGLHYQLRHPQGKLVTVLEGMAFDVVVDIRKGSPAFKQWMGLELSADNQLQLYIPPGFAHGFCALTESVKFLYKCTEFYYPDDERGILWNDPELKIAWPVSDPLLSAKDAAYKPLKAMMSELPEYDRRRQPRLGTR